MIEPYKNLEGRKALIFFGGMEALVDVSKVTRAVIYGKDELGRKRKIYKKVVEDYLIMD